MKIQKPTSSFTLKQACATEEKTTHSLLSTLDLHQQLGSSCIFNAGSSQAKAPPRTVLILRPRRHDGCRTFVAWAWAFSREGL